MLFRIVGPHHHQAVTGGHTFSCIRSDTTSDAGLVIRWAVSRNGVQLKADCRTLNEAKGLCRASAAADAAALGN